MFVVVDDDDDEVMALLIQKRLVLGLFVCPISARPLITKKSWHDFYD